MKKIYNVKNMTCSACSAKIENTLDKKGVKAKVNLISEKLVVETEKYTDEEIKAIVEGIGYILSEEKFEEEKDVNLYLVGILATVTMILGMMMHIKSGLIELILTSLVMYYSRSVLKDGYKKFIGLSFNMNTLITLGVVSSYIYSVYNYLTGKYNMLYFEGIAVILFVVLLGKRIEKNLKKNTNAALEKLGELVPSECYILHEGKVIKILTKDIVKEDILVLKEGQIAPADAIVISGSASFDENVISGESRYVEKNIGDEIIAGTTLVSGQLNAIVLRANEDTIISKIMTIVELSGDVKPKISRFVDKVSLYFVPIIITIAITTAITWYVLTGDISKAINHFIVILVIACPCSLGLATPASMTLGVGQLAKHNILIKNSEVLEYGYKINKIIMDKTGTLTEGSPKVVDIFLDDETLNDVYNIEKYVEHPLSKAIVKYIDSNIKVIEKEFEVRNLQGLGIMSLNYIIGNKKLIGKKKVDLNNFEVKYEELSKQGKTVIYVARDKKVVGLIALIDDIKESSYEFLNKKRKDKIEFSILTGDNKDTTKYIADKLNIKDFKAEVMPYEKSAYVEGKQDKNSIVAMVGDGINDAPALSTADVAIAVGSGADIAIKTGDIILMRNNLNDIDKFITISKRTMINIKENLFWGFIYNIFGVIIATGIAKIEISPMLASLFMMLSSISVLLNSLRLKYIKV